MARKYPFQLRLTKENEALLEKIAKREDRSMVYMANRILHGAMPMILRNGHLAKAQRR